jgi:hypothetical protein
MKETERMVAEVLLVVQPIVPPEVGVKMRLRLRWSWPWTAENSTWEEAAVGQQRRAQTKNA